MLAAAPAAGSGRPEIEALVRLSGLTGFLDEVPGVLLESLDAQTVDLPEATRGEMRRRLEEAFAAERLRADLIERLTAKPVAVELSSLVGWYEGTPAGQRLRDAERASRESEAREAMGRYTGTLAALPPSDERVALVRRFDRATQGSARLLHVARAASHTSLLAMVAVGRLTPDELPKQLDYTVSALAPQLREGELVRLLFVLRGFTREEIEESLAGLEGAVGRWWFAVADEVVSGVLDAGVERFEAGFAHTLPGIPDPS